MDEDVHPMTTVVTYAVALRDELIANNTPEEIEAHFVAMSDPRTRANQMAVQELGIAARGQGGFARKPLPGCRRRSWIFAAQAGASETGVVTTKKTRSTKPELYMACSTPGGMKMTSCRRTTRRSPSSSISPSPSST